LVIGEGTGGICCYVLVNNRRHSHLAMLSLTAIQPNRRRIVNLNCIRGRGGRRIRGRHESTEEPRYSRTVHRDGLAWLVEGGLGDGVIRRRKLKLYHIADRSHDVVWRESEGGSGRAADANDVYGDTACCCKGAADAESSRQGES